MGLDTSHDAWHGSYSSFNRFRMDLCRAAGYENLESIWDDVEVRGWDKGKVTVGVTEGMIQGEWDYEPIDPLMYLLQHSDCDGILPVKALIPLADRLEMLAPHMEYGWQPAAIQFAEGCRNAAAEGEDIIFA